MNVHPEPSHLPDRVAVLADAVAKRHLGKGIRQGRQEPPKDVLDRASRLIDDSDRWDARSVRELIEEAMRRFTGAERAQSDAWLAPRLHSALRMSRAEAAESGIWNFLALRIGPDYVIWRYPGRDPMRPLVAVSRYSGPFHLQAFARLWWMAELFRDGHDYGPVVTACGVQDMFHTALRMEVVHHRPIAQALARMLEKGTVRTGREVNALITAVNAAASTIMFEVLAPDEPTDGEYHRAWIDEAGTVPVPYESLPDGPDEGMVPESSIATLIPLFEDLFDNAPVRDRNAAEEGDEV